MGGETALLRFGEKFCQHFADWLGQQGIRLFADPDDIGAAPLDQVGVYETALVVKDVETDLDTVRNEGPARGSVFPMQNLWDNDVVGPFQVLGENLLDSHGNGDDGYRLGVALQFLGQGGDDVGTRGRVDRVVVDAAGWSDQQEP